MSLVKLVNIRAVCYWHIILYFTIVSGSPNAFQAYIEKEDSKKLKQKQRERMQPKMGKMDIDYQVRKFWLRPIKTRRKLMPYVLLFSHNGQDRCKMSL
jgi:ribonuclease HII